jgi:tetratricopeptide (TPR) repeat protein
LQFIQFLKETYPTVILQNRAFTINYQDDDGDVITVSSEIEWVEMNNILSKYPSRKIMIDFENKQIGKIEIENEHIRNKNCPFGSVNCFGCLYNPPQCSNQEFWYLYRLSIDCLASMDRNRILLGRGYILKMLEMVPNHMVALYNLACANSLLGNIDEAINNLERAIDMGYRDLEHILNDQDFNNIKYTTRFANIIRTLRIIINPSETILPHLNSFDEKVQKIMNWGFNVPSNIIRELLIKYNGDVDTVKTMLYN